VIGTWWILRDRTYYKAATKEELINYVSTYASAILHFSDTLTACGLADSSFYGDVIGPMIKPPQPAGIIRAGAVGFFCYTMNDLRRDDAPLRRQRR
jgi:hypothetical protein